jgi:hypothetical protein
MTNPGNSGPLAIVGWAAVVASAAFACVWAFWGAIENFHEGWYFESAWQNVGLMLAQYLGPAILFVALGLVAQRSPRIGALFHALLALAVIRFFNTRSGAELIAIPFALMSVAYGFGRVPRGRVPTLLVAGLPAMVAIAAGGAPAIRTATRIDDGRRDARIIAGNGVTLLWAPQGPGGPTSGVSWSEAGRRCAELSADGASVSPGTPAVPPWHLPSVEEVVRSMTRHGKNAGGTWDAASAGATYREPPDKETPLWNPHSQIIYWWTATAADSVRALSVTYDGKVWPRPKRAAYGYLGFRCVRPVVSGPA